MPGEQSVRSDEASDFRKILERPSPDSSVFNSELLSDLDSHKAHPTKAHRSSSHRRHRSHRDPDRGIDGKVLEARQLSRLLVHDEIEAVDMRKVLISTSERLEHETRRANDAESRARDAEARALALQLATRNAQAEALREKETLKAYQAQLEVARNEILRAQKELDNMAADRDRVEEAAARDRGHARAMAKELEVRQAFEQGKQEGKIQGFVDGRKEGWYIGTRDGKKETLRELASYDIVESDSSRSITPPLDSFGHNATAPSAASTATRSAAPPPAPVDLPTPTNHYDNLPRATSTRTATPQTTHKRSASLTQNIKARLRRVSDPKPPFISIGKPTEPPPAFRDRPTENAPTSIRSSRSTERLADGRPVQPAPSTSRDPGYVSPVPFNPPPSPRHAQTSPLPGGYIPLKENGRVALPAPHELDPPPPPSPHSPALPLPPDILDQSMLGHGLQPPNGNVNTAPTISVQEPTPPEPSVSMPEPHPAPAPNGPAENNVKPSRVLARDYAFGARPESPPLPPLPTERGSKGKQRQRSGRARGGGGLHAPGRSSPSDTSTEFSQFDIVTGAVPPDQQQRLLGRGNGSQLSVIMEGGSTAAESPEPLQPTMPAVKQHATPRMGGGSALSQNVVEEEAPYLPSAQGILNDPREYGDLPEAQLSPVHLARRQAIADQLRWTPSDGEPDMSGRRSVRDDVSIKSSTTRASAPGRKRPVNVKMPERLGPSRAVEVLEKQAAMYDAFGTGQKFPSFDSQSSPDEIAVATRTPPDFTRGHRRAMSSATSVPEITIQPPSRPSSHASKISQVTGNLSPKPGSVPMPVPGSPSRRHSMQGPPMTPSRIPLPHTTAQIPMTLSTPHHGDFTLPAGFVPMPMQGPPEVTEEFSSGFPTRTPHTQNASMPMKTPRMTSSGLGDPSNLPTRTPAGVPLPLSSATTHRGLPDYASSAPRGTGRSSNFDLPNVAATSYEPAPLPPGMRYPPSFAPARVPLPESVAGNSPHASAANQTPWGGWNSLGAGATPAAIPPSLGGDRPMAMYAGDGGARKKVSSSSLRSSQYKKFEPSTYLDPAYLASTESVPRNDAKDEERHHAQTPSRAGSMRSTKSNQGGQKSPYAASVETVTDEDEPSRSPGT